ncbi:MAG: 3-deoxy-D-manno-octulosonic acid kinase [Pseudomonadota bacterium]|nr:3-deoxy-D-manno-octulosonic acid kinase [Pseudomonadota bacterium]
MVAFDANESLTPFEHRRDGRSAGYGAILFDARRVQQAQPGWFDPAWWGERAVPVSAGGRGGAWFVEAPFGQSVLRHYLRGGLAAKLSRDTYAWHGADRTRSFSEFRLTRALHTLGLPVPRPIAACYWRRGMGYRAAILVERLPGVRSLGELAAEDPASAPWDAAGRLLARFHRAGLDHADLNADNILFNVGPPDANKGWLIDFDKGSIRIPATGWRERNLARLLRSLLKLRGNRGEPGVREDFARLRRAYDATWLQGT